MKHIVLAVSYRAEMLEQEMKIEADKVKARPITNFVVS